MALTLAAQAQYASCTFNFFSPTTQFKLQDGTPVFIQPRGINDFGTVVGSSSPGNASGLIRWTNGVVATVPGTHSLIARNDHGTSVGLDLQDQGILANGTTITPIVLDVNNSGVTEVNGINKEGTIVGRYVDNSGGQHGFKRWNTGTTHTLDIPVSAQPNSTIPRGINDNGTVVGSYTTPSGRVNGFIFHNGQWATLHFPETAVTIPVGISNAGQIIGVFQGSTNAPNTYLFFYENGIFKVIYVPNSGKMPFLYGISSKQGLIVGVTDLSVGSRAFTAQCQ